MCAASESGNDNLKELDLQKYHSQGFDSSGPSVHDSHGVFFESKIFIIINILILIHNVHIFKGSRTPSNSSSGPKRGTIPARVDE